MYYLSLASTLQTVVCWLFLFFSSTEELQGEYICILYMYMYSRRQNNVSIHRTVERKEFKRSTDRTTVKERYD